MMVAKILIRKVRIDRIALNGDLEDVRTCIKDIDFNIPGLSVLRLQPGVGKTYTAINILKERDSFLLVTGGHKLIRGEYDKLKAKPWVSFKDGCEVYSKVRKLDSCNVPKRMICRLQGCDQRKCFYWKQFNTKKAKAPYHFLTSDRVNNKDKKFKFDYLALDESMKGNISLRMDKEKLKNIICVISKYESFEILNEKFDVLNDEEMFFYVKSHSHRLTKIKYAALEEAINEKNWEDVKDISSFNVHDLMKFYYYRTIHPDMSSYSEPRMYHILDLARQGIPILLLDASFDEKAFQVIVGRYIYEEENISRSELLNQELNPITDINIRYYESHLKKPEKTIYRMDKDNFYYKRTFLNNNKELTENGEKTIQKLREYIKKAKRKYHNIGIITYQDLMPHFADLGKNEYFFNLRGSNELSKVDALFIIGTPLSPKEIVDDYNKLCMTNINKDDVYRRTFKKRDGKFVLMDKIKDKIYSTIKGGFEEKFPQPLLSKDFDGYENEKLFEKQYHRGEVDLAVWYSLPEYDHEFYTSEKYQAIHRARPFIENSQIYIFGDIPSEISEEFKVKSLDKENTDFFFNSSRFKGIYPHSLWHLIIEKQENGYKSNQIAEKLKLYKDDVKKGYNTSFVTKITKGEVTLDDILKIDQFLKEDAYATETQIKRKYRTLKAGNEFIRYCIHYMVKGSHIQNT